MRVMTFEGLGPTGGPQRTASPAEAGRFATMVARPSSQQPVAVSQGGLASLGALDALLALQVVPEAGGQRRHRIKRAHALLDRLEELRLGLLDGELPLATLQELRHGLATCADMAQDPSLRELAGDIELRLAVELAKLDQLAAAAGP